MVAWRGNRRSCFRSLILIVNIGGEKFYKYEYCAQKKLDGGWAGFPPHTACNGNYYNTSTW